MSKFVGIAYPLVKSDRGLLSPARNVDLLQADLLQLILTEPGERVMMPLYGTPLKQLLFEQNDVRLAVDARSIILDSIKTWEPRVAVSDIEVDVGGPQGEQSLQVSVKIRDPEDVAQEIGLELKVPLAAR